MKKWEKDASQIDQQVSTLPHFYKKISTDFKSLFFRSVVMIIGIVVV